MAGFIYIDSSQLEMLIIITNTVAHFRNGLILSSQLGTKLSHLPCAYQLRHNAHLLSIYTD